MKKLFRILVVCLSVLMAMSVFYACGNGDENQKGLVLTKSRTDVNYTVLKFVDDGKSLDENGVLDIGKLAKEQGRTVEKIKTNAFKDNDTIKKLIIPQTVTKIEHGAFTGMKALEEIVLPFVGESATGDPKQNYTTSAVDKAVDEKRSFGYIFGKTEYDEGKKATLSYGKSKTETYYLPYKLNKVTISPAKECPIPMYAFSGLVGVDKVVIGENVTAIGENAFSKSTVREIAFDNASNSKLSTIMKKAFYGAYMLGSIELPSSVTTIEESAFASDVKDDDSENKVSVNKLSSVVLSANLTEIGESAFAYCENLASVTFGGEILPQQIDVGQEAFAHCKKLNVTDDFKANFSYEKADDIFYDNANA